MLRYISILNSAYIMKSTIFASILLAAAPLTCAGQQLKSSYIDWGIRGSAFPNALSAWEKGQKWSEDDNFFISRVRPKQRFRNQATQVNPDLDENNDKKLIFWVPVNNEANNALPDGVYDSEVFPMWSYITHYGNWSAPLIRVPGNFSDVAHKNGVPVSALASIPYGDITDEWQEALISLTDCGAAKVADFLQYYGVDGIGYNSEFYTSRSVMKGLQTLHADLIRELRASGRNPLAEIIWYDGTNDRGSIAFDLGLKSGHNLNNWGYGDNVRSSLFLNYNWNYASILEQSVKCAEEYGRTPLDLYCGINMQGKEPKNNTDEIWTLLKDWNLSIGLWGAHSENMFWESRAEKGPRPENRLNSYLRRLENWFTGSTRNPVTSPEVNNSLKIAVDNDDFFGMSKLMSARSSLKWDLSEEPFISYFNLGNGRFFNYRGMRCHDSEWYNIGIQDYMPTWMWWFSKSFLGRTPGDVAAKGLSAGFVWDDAWMGGSLLRVNGSTDREYLHLFKTEFPLMAGDRVTVRYKVINGSADAALVLSAKGAEEQEVSETLMSASDADGSWVEKTFTIGDDFATMAGKEVAMIALCFSDAKDLDLRLGEVSIVRPGATSRCPDMPVIERAEMLSARHDGADAKIIFNMPNQKGDDVCYNTDVDTSLFKLYAREEGKEPVLMGMTTSWAGLLFSIPVEKARDGRVALGVSALSLDMTAESEIAWSEYLGMEDVYTVSDRVTVSKPVIKPGEAFSVGYADETHEPGDWTITDASGNVVAEQQVSCSIALPEGLEAVGNYTVRVNGMIHDDKEAYPGERAFAAMVQITGENSGNIPAILNAMVNSETSPEIQLAPGSRTATIEFEGEDGEARLSRGIRVGEAAVGFRFEETGLTPGNPFSISFWLKPDDFSNHAAHLLNIRDKGDEWSNNNWGWFWHTVDGNGLTDAFTMRMKSGGNVNYRFDNSRIQPGVWHHLAYVFDFDDDKALKVRFFLDGTEQEVTSWSRNDVVQSDQPSYQGSPYMWRKDNVVAVGGFVHKSGSVVGNVDNMMLWDTALDGEGVKLAMSDLHPDALPENLVSMFSFEQDSNDDFAFTGVGSSPFRGGAHDYEATETEGQGVIKWIEPQYCAGAPALSGDSFSLKTRASFYNYGGSVSDVDADSKSGSAILHFPHAGTYRAGVVLENEYGADVREFLIKVDESGLGIEGIDQATPENAGQVTVFPTVFDSYVEVTADQAGYYRLSLLTLDGRRVLVNDFQAEAGDRMRLYPSLPAGPCLLTLSRDDQPLPTHRLLKKW